LHNGLKQLGEKNMKIGIAGLNPHAGTAGLFGTEDDQEILLPWKKQGVADTMWKDPFP
jgi:4-hydroxy-L-threonine phosphate dehydrogenase PdxA